MLYRHIFVTPQNVSKNRDNLINFLKTKCDKDPRDIFKASYKMSAYKQYRHFCDILKMTISNSDITKDILLFSRDTIFINLRHMLSYSKE
jgi:hypothetical protein